METPKTSTGFSAGKQGKMWRGQNSAETHSYMWDNIKKDLIDMGQWFTMD
jgi:hypothetical protein